MARFVRFSLAVVGIGGALLLCLILLPRLLLAAPPSNPDVPAAPGTIAGVVTDLSGTPLAGINVTLYLPNHGAWLAERVLTTDSQGAFKAFALAAGTYRIGFRDPTHFYAPLFYPDAVALDSAQDIPVAGTEVTGVNAALQQAGAITGEFSHVSTSTISAKIVALVFDAARWQTAASTQLASSGAYTLADLQPGSYRVCAHSLYVADYIQRQLTCYDGIVSAPENALPVAVGAGAVTRGINLIAGLEGDGATISGRVTNIDGEPLAGIHVSLLSQSATAAGSTNSMTMTEETGRYAFRGVSTDQYAVEFQDDAGFYVAEYFNDARELGDATVLAMTQRAERPDVDAVLALGGILGGALRIEGGGKPDSAYVNVWDVEHHVSLPSSKSYYDRDSGTYRIGGVPPGRYVIYVIAWIGETVLDGIYGGTPSQEAIVVEVASGAILADLDITVGIGAFDGEISGRLRSDGQGVSGIEVTLIDAVHCNCEVVRVETDADGRYVFGGLTNGYFRVGYRDPAEVYANGYYSHALASWDADKILVLPAQKVSSIDAQLVRGGMITGTVLLGGGVPATDYEVMAYLVADSSAMTLAGVSPAVRTDRNGAYRMPGLRPGTYRICGAGSTGYPSDRLGCYGGVSGLLPEYGQDVPVHAGATSRDINLFLGPMPANAYLPAVAR